MIELIYCENGMPHSDFGIQEFVNGFCELHSSVKVEQNVTFKTSTENMVYAFRVAIRHGFLNPNQLVFINENEEKFSFDDSGKPNKPMGTTFLDDSLDTLVEVR